jgi:hypothetical protein
MTLSCRYCGQPTEYNFCSESCRKANNDAMATGNFASPEAMRESIERKCLSRIRANVNRKAREQAMKDCGLVKVRGALGGIYWE